MRGTKGATGLGATDDGNGRGSQRGPIRVAVLRCGRIAHSQSSGVDDPRALELVVGVDASVQERCTIDYPLRDWTAIAATSRQDASLADTT